jgi:iron complex outermembrane receptor protein
MKNLFYILLSILPVCPPLMVSGAPVPKVSLSGSIKDKNTGDPIPGVYVYLPDLKTGTISIVRANTLFKICPRRLMIQLSCIGYRTFIEKIDLSTTLAFEMEYTATEINEVITVCQNQQNKSQHNPITVVPQIVLLQNAAVNIIDALADQPGMAQLQQVQNF